MEEDRTPRRDEPEPWDDIGLEDLQLLRTAPVGKPPRRRRRWWVWLVAVFASIVAAAGVWLFYEVRLQERTGEELRLRLSPTEEATLYFADPRWTKLVPEPRALPPRADAVARMRSLVEALAEGPRGDAAAALPKGTRLRAAYVGKDGLAVLDLEPWPEGTDLGGVSGELLAVFSLVQTVAGNVPGIQTVQILVGGDERETLAGHVKISEPLRPEAPEGAPAR